MGISSVHKLLSTFVGGRINRSIVVTFIWLLLHLKGIKYLPKFPHRLENLAEWEYIFQSGKSWEILNTPEKSGIFTQNSEKVQEF